MNLWLRSGAVGLIVLLLAALEGCGASAMVAHAPSPSTQRPSMATTVGITTTTTTTATAPTQGVPSGPDYEAARQEWIEGADASSAAQGTFFSKATSVLESGKVHDGRNTTGYSDAVRKLTALMSLPDMDATAAEIAEARTDTLALNAFFGTNGLYGLSAPSTNGQQFVATLQQEICMGTLAAVDVASSSGRVPAALDATVVCPNLSSLSVGSGFGCDVSSPSSRSFILIGEVQGANATSFDAWFGTSIPCNGPDSVERAALRALGASCT